MQFETATCTDVGIRKSTNQDSMLVLRAETGIGPVLMAAICDGMGGLAKGEVASAAMALSLSKWFAERLPGILAEGFSEEKLCQEWKTLVEKTSEKISSYGADLDINLGTTAGVFLTVGDSYYIMNVGDSRVYLISDSIYQLTKDQTYVQHEVDLGHLTEAEALVHPKRSVLLQCIGASRVITPDFLSGALKKNQVYMLCCDGFRHVIQPQELYDTFNPKAMRNKKTMQKAVQTLVDLNKSRGEKDNISVILIKTS